MKYKHTFRSSYLRLTVLVSGWLLILGSAKAQSNLWQIGAQDNNNAEFALAPGSYAQFPSSFSNDVLYVVGQSSPGVDWPYVHPGPNDGWAGNRSHTFVMLFGLQSVPSAGTCHINFDLLDTHSGAPPQLNITVNGQSYSQALPAGAGDASVFGNPAAGQEYQFDIPFPSSLLQTGVNQINITTSSGSWFLYDWIGFKTPAGAVLATVSNATVFASIQQNGFLIQTNGALYSPVDVLLKHVGNATNGMLRVGNGPQVAVNLSGAQTVTALAPDVPVQTNVLATVTVGGQVVASQSVVLKPVRHLTIYILPHSHVDIGYTDYQPNIITRQMSNLVQGIAYAQQTATNPPGARFVWNLEGSFPVEVYFDRLNAQAQTNFLNAVAAGQVEINGMYVNELTGLCRPEDLLRLFRYGKQLEKLTGVPVESAMLSDVPDLTWGSVTAMAQAGIKYLSSGPNNFDRIGYVLQDWQNRPFYWLGPDGHSKVLAWISDGGYGFSHGYSQMSAKMVDDVVNSLNQVNYPYDVTYIRWSGHGDNGLPEPEICDFVRTWNAKYAYPQLVISGTTEAFRALEQSYSNNLPVVTGDWTPHWEDGSGSSAIETGMSRNSSDRLTQAQTLFGLVNPSAYSPGAFDSAWNNVLMYSEHTWGAWNSVSQPDSQFVLDQWAFKQNYAIEGANQSSNLLAEAIAARPQTNAAAGAVDVYNTLSWTRSEVVVLSAALSTAGDRVLNDQGQPVISQRLNSGELAFMASAVPALAARRYTVVSGSAYAPSPTSVRSVGSFGGSFLGLAAPVTNATASAVNGTLDNGLLHVRLDPTTGGIAELRAVGIAGNLVDASGGETLNDYRYQVGSSMPTAPLRNGAATISVGESGPLVASLVVQASAPGCNSLRRELRVVAGGDFVEMENLLDKTRVASGNYESVNFAFPFNIPGGKMLLDLPLGAMRPEIDQMLSACRNWLAIGRWAEITNVNCGVTWVTLDAPLIEVGSITATLFGSQGASAYLRTNAPGQKIYSWAMNNVWHTNYRAYQTGLTRFRYVIRPHLPYSPAAATRFATSFSQPLLPMTARGATVSATPLVEAGSPDIVVLGVKPSDDGAALMVHLFGAAGRDATANLSWAQTPVSVWMSDASEKPLTPVSGPLSVPAWGMVTLRAQLP